MFTNTTPPRRRAAARWLAFALAALLALPVAAADPVTPETTMRELRADPALRASGFYLWPQGEWNKPCKLRETDQMTLLEYMEHPTAGEAAGALNLIRANQEAGVQVTHPLYTGQEIADVPARAGVELYYFPGDGVKTQYVLVLGGNALESSGEMREALPFAWELHEMGYPVFVLRYRIWSRAGNNGPLEDACRAVQYITAHAAEFGVQTEDYAVLGSSSGGQIAGVLGSAEYGWRSQGLPKPGALLLAYPVVDFALYKLPYHIVMDAGEPGWRYYWQNLAELVTPETPPVFHWYGRNDGVLFWMNLANQSPALERALGKYGVPHEYRVYDDAPHVSATGVGTDAEGWLAEAVDFWQQQTAPQQEG